eukprot:760482-Hanusia_phi.AAC.2
MDEGPKHLDKSQRLQELESLLWREDFLPSSALRGKLDADDRNQQGKATTSTDACPAHDPATSVQEDEILTRDDENVESQDSSARSKEEQDEGDSKGEEYSSPTELNQSSLSTQLQQESSQSLPSQSLPPQQVPDSFREDCQTSSHPRDEEVETANSAVPYDRRKLHVQSVRAVMRMVRSFIL